MNIPVAQLIAKMNNHLQLATNQSEDTLREHITAIRTLCEVILDHNQVEKKSMAQHPSLSQIQVVHPKVKQNQVYHDNANGDSIFDF